jgi:predicted nucleic acid-binding protein
VTCLLDTDFLVSWVSAREARHGESQVLMARALEGAWGAPFVTDFVLDEALTLLMARGLPLEAADRVLAMVGQAIVPGGPAPVMVARVSDRSFKAAFPLFRRHFRRGLSFTDCTTLATMDERGADVIVSFDKGFDGLVVRAHS